MIKHQLYVKGQTVWALLTSFTNPEVLIPVKGIIKEIKYHELNPEYQIQVIKFYDSVKFLKKNLVGMIVAHDFKKRPRRFNKQIDHITTIDALNDFIALPENEWHFNFIVESIMVTGSHTKTMNLYNRMQDFLIERKLRELREFSIRLGYKGKYKFSGAAEFHNKLQKMIGDKVEKQGIKWKLYIDWL